MPQNDVDFIRSLFVDLSSKVDSLQEKTSDKMEIIETRLLNEIKELKSVVCDQHDSLGNRITECDKTIARHEGHFTTLKVLFTTGLASLIGIYYWVVSIIDKFTGGTSS